MAKKTKASPPDEIGELISGIAPKVQIPKKKFFAVRQKSGPKGRHYDDLVIHGTSGVEAHRQWFNYHGLHEQTHRFILTVVPVPDDHPLEKEAIECMAPRISGERTMEEILAEQHSDIEQALQATA